MDTKVPLSFIGLGALGAPMASNLLAAGFPLTLHNRTRERALPLQQQGAQLAESPLHAGAAAQVHALCLSDGAAVRQVVLGEQGLLAGAQPGGVIVDFSTIDAATTLELASEAQQRGLQWLDAPVTGGTEGARLGTLSVLVGGDAACWSACARCCRRWAAPLPTWGPVVLVSGPRL